MWNIPSQERLDRIPRLYANRINTIRKQTGVSAFFYWRQQLVMCEFDGNDLFFGYAILNGDNPNAEWGYFSFSELEDISINGIEVDCEHESLWPPKPVSEIPRIMWGRVAISTPICK